MRVPQEIANIIIHLAEGDPTTLRSLCLVSTSFLHKAQRVLYRKIRIVGDFESDDAYPIWFIDLNHAIKLLLTIVDDNQGLAKYIRTLHLPVIRKQEYLALACRGLRLMDNLETLTGTVPESVLSEDTKFQLKNFQDDWCLYGYNKSTKSTKFLASQTGLKSLFVSGNPFSDEPFPETFFPRLEALGGDRNALEKILPGRPLVTKLFWVSDLTDDVTVLPHTFTLCFPNLRVLTLLGGAKRPNLKLLLPYLFALRVLHICGESPNLPLYDEFALVPDFPSLQIFVWSAGPLGYYNIDRFAERMTKGDQRALATSLFNKTTVLQKVCIFVPQSGGIVLPSPTEVRTAFLCWERDKVEPRVIGFSDIIELKGSFPCNPVNQ